VPHPAWAARQKRWRSADRRRCYLDLAFSLSGAEVDPDGGAALRVYADDGVLVVLAEGFTIGLDYLGGAAHLDYARMLGEGTSSTTICPAAIWSPAVSASASTKVTRPGPWTRPHLAVGDHVIPQL
jgi:hypothetical protein